MDKERLFRHLERKYCSKCEIVPNLPLGVNADDIWEEILQSRRDKGILLPLTNVNGDAYWYLLTNKMISASEVIVDELMEHDNAQELHNSSVSTIEEIYYTGFMEGAQISIKDAMEFLQSGEEPETVEELILMNNRQAAGFAAENMYHAIDGNYLHNLAYFLTEGLDNGGGNFRLTDSIDIPSMQGELIKLPSASMIPKQVECFSGFLADTKIHPLIKAAAAQAWILAVRPFPEGNERLARLLSNVILIRAGYSFFGDISISAIITRTSYDYFRAAANILRTENGADLTYFMEYYMTVLAETVNELRARREQSEHDMIVQEQNLAKMPLSENEKNSANDEKIQMFNAPTETSEGSRDSLISELKQRIKAGSENARKVAEVLLEYAESGKYRFSSDEIAAQFELSLISVRNSICYYSKKGYIHAVSDKKLYHFFEFTFAQNEKKSDDTCENTSENFSSDPILQMLIGKRSVSWSTVSDQILKYYGEGKNQFSSLDLSADTGIGKKSINNYLRAFEENRVIQLTEIVRNVKYYAFTDEAISVISERIKINGTSYSEAILDTISMLKNSTSSQKDRRIGKMLSNALTRGVITKEDYIEAGELTKWNTDMQFVVQMGIIEKINCNEYMIKSDIDISYRKLKDSQKNTLSALYDLFGEDAFSVDMVIANLEYSSSHISGILHQFTWLRLLDCTTNVDNTHCYQLNVNPVDNPECFGIVA